MDSKEWLDDYMSIKQVNPNNPFTVPVGYFDELHQKTISRAALDELNAKGEGFSVPENYFKDMQAKLQSRVNIEAALGNTTGDFIVPANYFEDLQQQITSRVAVEEMLNGQTEGFTVPANYFDNLQNAITTKIAVAEPAVKQRGIVRKLVTSGVFKYAIAACFTLAVGGTLLFRQMESPLAVHNRSYIHKALSNVPDEDIINYLQMHMDAADTRGVMEEAAQINTGDVDAEDLKNYLSTH